MPCGNFYLFPEEEGGLSFGLNLIPQFYWLGVSLATPFCTQEYRLWHSLYLPDSSVTKWYGSSDTSRKYEQIYLFNNIKLLIYLLCVSILSLFAVLSKSPFSCMALGQNSTYNRSRPSYGRNPSGLCLTTLTLPLSYPIEHPRPPTRYEHSFLISGSI